VVVIPGTTNPDHLRANIAAAEVAAAEVAENLTDAEVARLTGLVDESKAVIDQPHQFRLDALGSAAVPIARGGAHGRGEGSGGGTG
jgi:pyridoxine 4-dehydrogenase